MVPTRLSTFEQLQIEIETPQVTPLAKKGLTMLDLVFKKNLKILASNLIGSQL